jgi:hypothetical protein
MFILTISTFAKADFCYYGCYQVKYEIILNSGESFECYNTISTCDIELDSLRNPRYFDRLMLSSPSDSLILYKNRLPFYTCIEDTILCQDNHKDTLSVLLDKIIISKKNIKELKEIESRGESAIRYISTSLQMSDSSWIRGTPLRIVSFWGNVCGNKLHIYEESNELQNEINKLTLIQYEINNLMNSDNLDWDTELTYNEKFLDVIHKIDKGYKVVTISGCSD